MINFIVGAMVGGCVSVFFFALLIANKESNKNSKQIPKKYDVNEQGCFCCPSCKTIFFDYDCQDYCGYCGQLIDWSDAE